MHIPDGYLSPATCAGGYLAAVPFWGVAVTRVRRFIGGRTVPLLAIFSAFSFAIMMFNVPVPGGTTAHGVGGTLTAIVLGPWAAIISTSVALIIQALFFGDGGITAIGVNCLNMGVILPMAGYFTYRILAGRSGMLTQRRVIAAAIGSYVGISLAALFVGIELGIQPHFWSTNGVPDYSPYNLTTAIPAMLLSHMLGASFVEGAITALGVSYLQKSYPEILLRRSSRTAEDEAQARKLNPWAVAVPLVVLAAGGMFAVGLIKGHGHLDQWAGLNWSTVSWADAAGTVIVSLVISAVVLPAVFFLMRRQKAWRGPVLLLIGMLIWVPIGLIAPGGAFAEESTATQAEVTAALQARSAGDSALFEKLPDINQQCACVPSKIENVTYSGNAILAGYQPPWVHAGDSAWKQNLGYQFAGFAGMGGLFLLAFAIYRGGKWLAPTAPPDWRNA
ncbi:MAG: cobalt transporter CbiM [Tepidiformaceae bacterium]